MTARTVRLLHAHPTGAYGCFRVTLGGEKADWWFARAALRGGPGWRLSRLARRGQRAEEYACTPGGAGAPPSCDCQEYRLMSETCPHLEALAGLVGAGKLPPA